MYEKIEALFNEGKLSFSCNHKTNPKALFEGKRKRFLEDLKRQMGWFERGWTDAIIRDVYCFDCGEYVDYHLVGDTLVANSKECFHESEVVVDIPVPTGELLFADWFENATKVIGDLDDDSVSINCTKGVAKRIHDYAKAGIGHFYVGNTCPSIHQKDGVFYVGNAYWDEDDNEIPVVEGGEKVGSVTTDLWWVTVCDRAVYEKIAQSKFGEEKGSKIAREDAEDAHTVLRVEPGIYRIRYFTDRSDDSNLFATIEKVK